jgi:two-component system, NarL family, response regulator DegU
MNEIRVFLADDHPIVRKGIHDLLEASEGIQVIGEAPTGEQALQMIKALQPDIMIVDIELPDISGIDVVNRINEEEIPIKVLVLSSYDDREYIAQMLSLGVSGYLIKDEVPEAIVEALHGIARGERGWVSRKVAERLSQMLDKTSSGKDLTQRELDVIYQLTQGKTNAEIAYALGISEKTVEKHLDLIFRKMGVASRVEAAVIAVREHIV